MRSSKFKVLSDDEIKLIHEKTLEVLERTGVKVELKKLRDMFSDHGCTVDEETKIVKFKPDFVMEFLGKAPSGFVLCGSDIERQWPININSRVHGGLGTAMNMYSLEDGSYKEATLQDAIDHIILFEHLDNIVSSQMDVWPYDIPMHTIHAEAILGWIKNSTKSFGMGAYGVLATNDMVDLVEIAVGGKDVIQNRHPYMTIISIQSPLSSAQIQLEGLVVLAERGQPTLMSPEAMAGTTAPVTLAGLLVQHNAEVISHILMAQVVNPGVPVMYGSVSTIAEMKRGTVALGSVETGLISAAAVQLAHHYKIPCRCVAGATEAKTLDMQCALERERSMLMAALSGGNYITSVGTIESTCAGAHELAAIDNEIIGGVERAVRGIEVSEDSLAVDLINKVGPDGSYIMEEHTQMNFRKEHFIPKLADRDKRDIWEQGGSREMVDRARDMAKRILADHRERELDSKMHKELESFVESVRKRTLEDFYKAEWEG